MNTYMNKRLKLRNDSIDLAPYPLVLRHLDFCRRNMILQDDGIISLVDWGFAGLSPRFFEVAMVSCVLPCDAPYEQPVLQEMEKVMGLTEDEKRLIRLLHSVQAAYLGYLL